MRIRIDLKIFIFVLIFVLTHQIKMYGIIMLFAFIHELGHLIVGILLKFKPEKIEIMPYGLSIAFKVSCDDYNKRIKQGRLLCIKKLLIACAGPLTNFLLVIIFYYISIKINSINNINNINIINVFVINKELLIYSNLLIGLFNLIPIYPLDGGRIVKEILHISLGLKRSYDLTYKISKITICIITAISSILVLYVKNIAIVFICIYLWYLFFYERKKYLFKKQIYNIEIN